MVDGQGKPVTQSLFLEMGYSEYSIYTLKEVDHEYQGVVYPSLKKLYLEEEDPTEYEFATKYLLGYKHWKRLCANRMLQPHIEEWREELEMKLRSKAVKDMLTSAKGGNYQAAKWFADRGWATRAAGRPSKEEVQREKEFQARTDKEYGSDIVRLFGTGNVA